MSHPGEEFDQVSTWISGASETASEIVDGLHGVIAFRRNNRVAIDDGHDHRCRSASKMLVPLSGFDEAVGCDYDSFCHLFLVKPLY